MFKCHIRNSSIYQMSQYAQSINIHNSSIYLIIQSELNENCLYVAVIQSNDIRMTGEPLDEELPERAQGLRLRKEDSVLKGR